ncbi:hypothetical protein ABGF48_07495 [Helcococcus bovis]|uniref:hypothetical protein n=1 Tax=Helcococcus bovis TaxID=3153252 RepID=UPI0038B95915
MENKELQNQANRRFMNDMTIEDFKKIMLFKNKIKEIKAHDDFGCSASIFELICRITTELQAPQSISEIIFDATLLAFNWGHIQGFRHCKDNGVKPVNDGTSVNLIDINKQIEELEQIELFKKLFNFECI